MKEIILHENIWWWGKSYTFITSDGRAMVKLSLDDEIPRAGYINSLMVFETDRQQGIGTALMKEVEAFARKLDLGSIYLDARKGTFLIDWYRRLGFSIYNDNCEHTKGNCVAMCKWLKEA